jgi:P-type Cu2+ transporter
VTSCPHTLGLAIPLVIAMSTSAVAIESADVFLASSDPRAVESIIRLSGASCRKMIQNLWWAAGYTVLAIPLAAGALAWIGVVMPPAVGALLMSLSTIIVAINAMTLQWLDLTPPDELASART